MIRDDDSPLSDNGSIGKRFDHADGFEVFHASSNLADRKSHQGSNPPVAWAAIRLAPEPFLEEDAEQVPALGIDVRSGQDTVLEFAAGFRGEWALIDRLIAMIRFRLGLARIR